MLTYICSCSNLSAYSRFCKTSQKDVHNNIFESLLLIMNSNVQYLSIKLIHQIYFRQFLLILTIQSKYYLSNDNNKRQNCLKCRAHSLSIFITGTQGYIYSLETLTLTNEFLFLNRCWAKSKNHWLKLKHNNREFALRTERCG